MEITDMEVTDDNTAAETGLEAMEVTDTTLTAGNSAIATEFVDSNGSGEASSAPVLTSPTIPTISTPTSIITYTPTGSQQWINRIDEKFTPAIGKTFMDLDLAILFYEMYAIACGFSTRKSSTKRFRDGIIRTKCLVCNREGFNTKKRRPAKAAGVTEKANESVATEMSEIGGKKTAPKKPAAKRRVNKGAGVTDEAESSNKGSTTRITKIRRWGCPAMIKFKFDAGKYRVDRFIEGHNHPLEVVKNREFEKLVENVNEFHMQMIVSHSKANVGASLTHQLCTQQFGGFQNVGATVKQFKNFQRDMKCLMNSHDGEMFKSRLDTLAETKGLHFVYQKDSKNALTRIFWTDSEMQRAYALFGDGLSYDPTYGTNKYNMTFTPFTGIDHHKRSITFACALIEHEDDESFMWVFDQFLEAMGGKEPNYIITDEDPGIIKAVPAKFKTAKHRFCMWHIMKKITDKVGSKICRDTDFLTRLNSVVWNDDLEPREFEEQWLKVISDFSLEDNTWLSGKFADRHTWIPAYFRDVPMGSLLRTTQRSESTNSFFKRFENKYGTLTEFLLRYESATDQQKHMLKLLEEENANSIPETLYGSKWETQAVRCYTHTMFFEFQQQVKLSINTCSLGGYTPPDPVTNFEVSLVEDADKGLTFAVECNRSTIDVRCTCKLFERRGILCSHIIWACSGKFKDIPDKYILQRWSKNALKGDVYDWNGNLLEKYNSTSKKQLGMAVVWSEIQLTVGMLKRKEESDVREFAKLIKEFRTKLDGNTQPLTKQQQIELLLDCRVPKETNILPPNVSRNKGCGKRLVSKKHKAIEKAKKAKRLCANCKRMSHHDKRNCPNDFVEHAPVNQGEQSEEEEDWDENEE